MLKAETYFVLGVLAALAFAYSLVGRWEADTEMRVACAKAYPDNGRRPPAGTICEFYWKEGEGK